jgi:hypothetical protein
MAQLAIDPALERTFHLAAQQLYADTAFLSSVHQMVAHPCYLRIVGMGPAAVPLLLRELPRRPALWLWALNAITGEGPASGTNTVRQATERWLAWGRDRGLIGR